MKIIIALALFPLIAIAQTGPGGIGTTDGTSQLELWLRDAGTNTTVNGVSVTSWNDQSGNGNHVSDNGGSDPVYASNVRNGFPAVYFTNDDMTGPNLGFGTGATDHACFFVIHERGSTSNFETLFSYANRDYGHGSSQYLLMGSGGVRSPSVTFSDWHIYSMVSNGTGVSSGSGYGNGTLGNSTTTASINGSTTQIGNNSSINHDIAEVMVFSGDINEAQRIIIENYLSAKYAIGLNANDLYNEDDGGSGNYDYDVAGIGRVDISNVHNDAQGTGIVRIHSPNNLGDNEFLIWGHNNGSLNANGVTDLPATIQSRLARDWSASETGEVGTVSIRIDLSTVPGTITTSDLRLLVDADGTYNSGTTIHGPPTALGANVYEWTGIDIDDNDHFTVGSTNATQTPLPIKLVHFEAKAIKGETQVLLYWQTAAEINNDYFTIEHSMNGLDWENVIAVEGQGNSTALTNYSAIHSNVNRGLSYYRLKQTDFDGSFSYSNVESVSLDGRHSVNAYTDLLEGQVYLTGSKTELDRINVYNNLGQDVTHKTQQLDRGEKALILDLSELKSGLYYIKTKRATRKVYR